ncbi:hypothetical protein ACJRO7_007909 [Eucalyptus globulus]|uniref:Protein kinase domain-containing protein n=1 Tax=Eucalyptus globulus TaxID=34317 RepID=A0ABD3IPT0_EUCGL
MGCFPCFDSREEETLNPDKGSDDPKHGVPNASSKISSLPSGVERLRSRSNLGLRRDLIGPKDGPGIHIAAQTFTFCELATATKNFRPEYFLGEGGFGGVYKGKLETTGQVVAVKQLDRNGLQGNCEFLVEVLMLSLLHHPNLLSLIGYCADGDQRLLVYEFMPFGSLEDHLFDLPPDKEPLDWNTRMTIAAGAAKGLEYLHDKANPPVIYRDFKSSNILLDEGFHPKLSDFGLAKLGPVGDKSHVSTRVMGTYGYCAPEDAMTGQLTVKSDFIARPLFNERRKFLKLADPSLKGRYPIEQAAARPLIGDMVMALFYLANQAYDPNIASNYGNKGSGVDERGSKILRNEDAGGSGRSRWEFEGSEKDNSPKDSKLLNRDLNRERAVAEAKMWGENWREKRRQSAQGSFDGSNGQLS